MIRYRDWLSLIVRLGKTELLKQSYLHINETVVQVRIFEYQSRISETFSQPQALFKNYKEYIHTDAYKRYEKVTEITLYFCWTHLRQ